MTSTALSSTPSLAPRSLRELAAEQRKDSQSHRGSEREMPNAIAGEILRFMQRRFPAFSLIRMGCDHRVFARPGGTTLIKATYSINEKCAESLGIMDPSSFALRRDLAAFSHFSGQQGLTAVTHSRLDFDYKVVRSPTVRGIFEKLGIFLPDYYGFWVQPLNDELNIYLKVQQRIPEGERRFHVDGKLRNLPPQFDFTSIRNQLLAQGIWINWEHDKYFIAHLRQPDGEFGPIMRDTPTSTNKGDYKLYMTNFPGIEFPELRETVQREIKGSGELYDSVFHNLANR